MDEWFLTADEWADAGVGPGPLRRPREAQLSTVVAPGDQVLLGIAVRGEDLDAGHTMIPRVEYTQGGKQNETTLSWEVKVVPAGEECER